MDPRARDFAGGKESRNGCAALEVRLHAAHDVMCGGTDRNPIPRKIEPGSPTGIRNQRKSLVDEIGIETLERQVHRPARPLRFAYDASRNKAFSWRLSDRNLVELSLTTGQATAIGETHTAVELGASVINGMAFAPPPACN